MTDQKQFDKPSGFILKNPKYHKPIGKGSKGARGIAQTNYDKVAPPVKLKPLPWEKSE